MSAATDSNNSNIRKFWIYARFTINELRSISYTQLLTALFANDNGRFEERRWVLVLCGLLGFRQLRELTAKEHYDADASLLFKRGLDEGSDINRFEEPTTATRVGDWTLNHGNWLRSKSLRRDEDGVKQAEAIQWDVENRASRMTLKVGIETGHERVVERNVSLVNNAIQKSLSNYHYETTIR